MTRIRHLKAILCWALGLSATATLSLLYGADIIYPDRSGKLVMLDESSRGDGNRDKVDDDSWMREVTVTKEGVVQSPASLDTEPRAVEERIIDTLKGENQQIVADLNRRKAHAQDLETELAYLKEVAQHPGDEGAESTKMDKERQRISHRIQALLESSRLAADLKADEKRLIAVAAVDGYMEIMRRSRLGMSERLKQQILTGLMPDYSLCLSEGLPFVATSPRERQRLLEYLQTQGRSQLQQGHLREDLETVTQECFSALTAQINQTLNAG